MGFEIIVQDESMACARCGPVFLNMLYTSPSVPLLDRLAVAQRTVMTEGTRFAVLTIIDPRVGKDMDRDARHRAKQISNEMEALTIANCFIVLGSGFFAAMVRSVVAGIQLFTQQTKQWKVASTRDEGVAWLLQALKTENKNVDAAELASCIDALVGGGPTP